MTRSTQLDWSELLGLQVVRKVEKLAAKRWNLGLGYVDATSNQVLAPRLGSHGKFRGLCQMLQDSGEGRASCQGHAAGVLEGLRARESEKSLDTQPFTKRCHAGLLEIVAPIVVDGSLLGALLCGGYRLEDEASDALESVSEEMPRLGIREASFVMELLEEAAAEISAYLLRAEELASDAARQRELRDHYESTLGSCQPMQDLYALLDKVVAADSTVLITGENGTGKELVAKAIHKRSRRKGQRFVVHNCSAFNDNLIDSELFGHVRGAFTGAVSDKKGLFEVADRGTFFLDEIGDMSPTLQVKILRVLQEGTFTSVGGTETKHVDVRIVAATNRDLPAMVAAGTFREDLFYRINVINLELPALRERAGDLMQLADHFLAKHGGEGKSVSADCLDSMRRYRWPGNVRELENEMERMVVLAGEGEELGPELLSARVQAALDGAPPLPAPVSGSLPEALADLEKRMIYDALMANSWNKTRAATQLQVSRRNLIRLVQKYELEPRPEPSTRA